MKRLLWVFLVAALAGCNTGGAAGDRVDTSVSTVDTGVSMPLADTSQHTPSLNDPVPALVADSIINIKFPSNAVSVTIKGELKGIGHPVTVLIPVKQGKQLTANITPEDSTANVRFNQVFTPDGKADGPFGRDISRKIDQQGVYKLLIGENLMQGDEWKGKFLLTVTVK